MIEPLRVAVAGASGIGRHHANWHTQVGGEVVAFLGSHPDRCEQTAQKLTEMFGFSGRGHTDLAALLDQERPDVLDVCTPNELHYEAARLALSAGCHVLCEKPIVWDAQLPPEGMREQARDLAAMARAAGRNLGLCSQYAAALGHYRKVFPDWDPTGASTFEAELETLARGRERDAVTVWVDMGSHPLSLLLAVLPEAQILPNTLEARFAGRTAEATFMVQQGDRQCACRVVVRDREGGGPTRRFGFDGRLVECAGRPGDDGLYRSVLTQGGRDDVGDDYMHLLIRQFHHATREAAEPPLVPVEVAIRNLELQLQILEAA